MKTPHPDQDAELFRQAVADARPLQGDKALVLPPPPPPRARLRQRDERAVLKEMLEDPPAGADLETGEELLYARSGLQRAVLRKLRRGGYSVGAQLDLHGMTASQAKLAIVAFLASARAKDLRCVRIIHGKGHGSRQRQPVLKVKVNHWLRQRDEVLAFASAPPSDGGTGAIYVLLRRL